MRTILVMTSTYPRWKGDVEPAFVRYLSEQIVDKFRVVILAPHYAGARSYERQHDILIYRFRYFFSFAEKLAYDGGIITNLKKNRLKYLLVPFFLVSEFVYAGYLCLRYRIRLVHAHWLIPQGLVAVFLRAASFGRIRFLCTSHGGDLYSLKSGILKLIKRLVLLQSNHLTVVSDAMKKDVVQMGVDPGKVTVRSMGVDLVKKFTVYEQRDKNVDLIFVGRLVEKKGVPVLLNALLLVKNRYPNISLKIVGDGPDRRALVQQVARLNLQDNVEFFGPVSNNELPVLYNQANISVVPSIVARDGDQEGLGLVAVEALGCGCATIVSSLRALEDVVLHEKTGLVFRAGDAQDLANKIIRLLEDEQLCSELGQNGREYVLDKFDWHVVGKAYEGLLDAICR